MREEGPWALSRRGHQLDMAGSPPKMPPDGPGRGQQLFTVRSWSYGRHKATVWQHAQDSSPVSRPHTASPHTLHHLPAPRPQRDARPEGINMRAHTAKTRVAKGSERDIHKVFVAHPFKGWRLILLPDVRTHF